MYPVPLSDIYNPSSSNGNVLAIYVDVLPQNSGFDILVRYFSLDSVSLKNALQKCLLFSLNHPAITI